MNPSRYHAYGYSGNKYDCQYESNSHLIHIYFWFSFNQYGDIWRVCDGRKRYFDFIEEGKYSHHLFRELLLEFGMEY